MNTKARIPALAAWAATDPARLPVEAQARVSKPNSRALVLATATTRSLKEKDGFTVSFLMYRLSRPRTRARFLALMRGVKPALISTAFFGVRREQVVIAPDAVGALGNPLPAHHTRYGFVVVGDLQGTEAEVAHIERLRGVLAAALLAKQALYIRTPVEVSPQSILIRQAAEAQHSGIASQPKTATDVTRGALGLSRQGLRTWFASAAPLPCTRGCAH